MRFMGYEVGGQATDEGDLMFYEVVAQAPGDLSVNGDDLAVLHGPLPGMASWFQNGDFHVADEGTIHSIFGEDDYQVIRGRWERLTDERSETVISAKVIGWTDGGNADLFEDEHGFRWRTAHDAIDGTIAVERTDGARAGVFRWELGTEDRGEIGYARDGDTYGVACTEEFVTRDGQWVQNEG